MPAPIDNLLELLALAQDQARPEVAQWLDQSISDWLDAGGTLDKCLGLAAAGNGKRTARTQYLKHKQRQYLCDALNEIDSGLALYTRAGKLAEAIEAFQGHIWPAWREYDAPPKGTGRLRSALFLARQCGELPQTQGHLHELLKKATRTRCEAWLSQKLA